VKNSKLKSKKITKDKEKNCHPERLLFGISKELVDAVKMSPSEN